MSVDFLVYHLDFCVVVEFVCFGRGRVFLSISCVEVGPCVSVDFLCFFSRFRGFHRIVHASFEFFCLKNIFLASFLGFSRFFGVLVALLCFSRYSVLQFIVCVSVDFLCFS